MKDNRKQSISTTDTSRLNTDKQPIAHKKMERPISEAYPVIDTDLARDNIENDTPNADLQDL